MAKTKFISIRLDEELYEQFKTYVQDNLLNGAAVLRDLIRNQVYNNTPETINKP